MLIQLCLVFVVFFFHDTAPTEIYTLSLHDALPILGRPRKARSEDRSPRRADGEWQVASRSRSRAPQQRDRKSTRLNSSHRCISYAVFCLKKKKQKPR